MNIEEVGAGAVRTSSAVPSKEIDSVALLRLIEEVRSSDTVVASASYNRTYNRHNR